MRNETKEGSAPLVSEATFRRAFMAKKNIKLLGCKGSFHTCEFCNNALDMLHDTSKQKNNKYMYNF